MKGIVIAGGKGTRVQPMTISTSKCLLPVYNKPMVYYPVCALMMAGVRDLLVISRSRDRAAYEYLLGDGSAWGMQISFAEQRDPRGGIAEAFLIGEAFLGNQRCALALGDNVFIGGGLRESLRSAAAKIEGATVFALQVKHPERYGIITFDQSGQPEMLEEKPSNPQSNWAVTGLYFFDNSVVDIAKQLKPSGRGELEITDVNRSFLNKGKLRVERLSSGIAWYDAGTIESLFKAASHIRNVERNQRQPVGFPELVALENGWIDHQQLVDLSRRCKNSDYGRYLKSYSLGDFLA